MPQVQPYKLYPYPDGWYAVGFSNELKNGELLTRPFMGKEVIVFRTESGQACVTEPYCPHMGAHLGHGGTVEGETVRCPFHGFCFDTKGECVSTGYGTKPNPKGKLHIYHAQEKNGIILVYYSHTGEAPTWDVPTLDMTDYTPLKYTMWELDSHPQETSENSVDIGHLSIVHGYEKVDVLEPLKTEGPYLYSKYTMTRRADFVGMSLSKIKANFEVHVHGLGYSFVQVEIPKMGMRTRQFVLSTPIGDNKIQLRIALAVEYIKKPGKIFPPFALLPSKLITKLVSKGAFKGFMHDVGQDFKIWENKVYVQPPALAAGDGPVGQYRVWAKQFYPKDAKPELIAKIA